MRKLLKFLFIGNANKNKNEKSQGEILKIGRQDHGLKSCMDAKSYNNLCKKETKIIYAELQMRTKTQKLFSKCGTSN